MKKIKVIIAVIAGIYLLILVAAFFMQDSLVFYPEKLSENAKYNLDSTDREVFIKTADGETINGILYKRHGNKYVVVYFHGNAGSLMSWQQVAPEIQAQNCDLLIIDNRGYGKSTGRFSEAGFYEDGRAALKFLQEDGYRQDQVIAYGRSLGTGIATELAVGSNIKALILESPYTSMSGLATEKMPYTLPWLLLKYKLNTLERAPQLKCPVLILHGKSDELIPYAHGSKIYDAITSPKKIVLIEGGGHNNLSDFPEHANGLREFLQSL